MVGECNKLNKTVEVGLLWSTLRVRSTSRRNKRNSAADQEKYVPGSRHHNYRHQRMDMGAVLETNKPRKIL